MASSSTYDSYQGSPAPGNDSQPQYDVHVVGNPSGGMADFNDLEDTPLSVGYIAINICYGGFFTSLFYVINEKYNRYIRFWAWLNLIVGFPLTFSIVVCIFVAWGGNPSALTAGVVLLFLHFLVASVLSYYAYQGSRSGILPDIPILGQFCRDRARVSVPFLPLNPKLQL